MTATTRGMVVGLALLGALVRYTAAQCEYEVAVIYAPPCPWNEVRGVSGLGLSAAGEVAGAYSRCSDGYQNAFLWTREDGLVALSQTPAFLYSRAIDVNSAGDAVGFMAPFSGTMKAALWRGGQVLELGTGEGNESKTSGINDAGVVVGSWNDNIDGPSRAFVWCDGVMTDLVLPQGPNSQANDINDRGQIVGWMGNSLVVGGAVPFVWDDGVVSELEVPAGATSAEPRAINDRGDAVGVARWSVSDRRAVLWIEGTMTVVAPSNGFLKSWAFGINDVGQAVVTYGETLKHPNASTAFLWQHGSLTSLDELIPAELYLRSRGGAGEVNDAGQILIFVSSDQVNFSGSVVLTPIGRPAADVDIDCTVGLSDLLFVMEDWGRTDSPADVNGDGLVDVDDLIAVLLGWD